MSAAAKVTPTSGELNQVQVRAFGKEKTEVFDKFKSTELKTSNDNHHHQDNDQPKPIYYHWEDVNVHTPASNENSFLAKTICHKKVDSKHIIRDVSGIVKPGSMMAIMGASGAGKTTLLNVINFRNKGDLKISGRVKINGRDVNSAAEISEVSGYVQQEDLFIGFLKVKEQLTFQANLKMDKNITPEQRKDRVEEIMEELNLKKCENTLIGVAAKNIKGISGGEKRRLAFGCELITDPNLLFCDEPTSGLDSFMAMSIVDCMRKLADNGKTIICTIHQPSSEIFQKFDRLCLLAEGRLAYIGDSKEANKFFESQGFPVPSLFNPADHFINTLAVVPSKKEASLQSIDKICTNFQGSALRTTLDTDIKSANFLEDNSAYNIELSNNITYRSNIFIQFKWLLWRASLAQIRDPLASYIAVLQTIVIAIIFGLIYLRQNYDQAGIQNLNGVLFLMVTNMSFSNIFAVVNKFTFEIPIILKEHHNGMYRIISYYLSQTVVSLPQFVLVPFLFVTIVYWMCNLTNDGAKYIICCVIIILVANVSVSFGEFISATSPSPNVALALSGPILVPLMIFSGFFLNNASVPAYFIWLKYLSWLNYANELLLINQWDGVTNITCSTVSTRCLTTGEQVLNTLDMKTSRFLEDFLAIGALLIGYRLLTFLALLFKSYRKH